MAYFQKAERMEGYHCHKILSFDCFKGTSYSKDKLIPKKIRQIKSCNQFLNIQSSYPSYLITLKTL